MEFNAHTHVHNLASIFTPETLHILKNRLSDWPGPLAESVIDLVDELVSGTAGDTAERRLMSWVEEVSRSETIRSAVDRLPSQDRVRFELPAADLLDELLERSVSGAIRTIRERLFGAAAEAAPKKGGIGDILAFLHLGLQPSIKQLTRLLMEQQPDDGAVVALTMDITEGGDADRALFERQLRLTSAEILRYPGRFFPFVAVNSRRTGHFEVMERALSGQGYVGVKLYPSLGYQVDSRDMYRVYAYCAERSIPILMHCSPGGFYRNKPSIAYCNPEKWHPVLRSFPELTVCFAHFGGSENLLVDPVPEDSWTASILQLMQEFENVYTDVSYNDEVLNEKAVAESYFDTLSRLLTDTLYRDRILFGSDFFLLALAGSESAFKEAFSNGIGRDAWERIAERNPKRYLGFGRQGAFSSAALANYVRFVADAADRCEALPATWLAEAISSRYGDDVTFDVSDFGSRWSRNNTAHVWLYWFIRDHQMIEPERARFAESGGVSVRTLQYWNKEHDPPEIFDQKCRGMAERVDATFRRNNAAYEMGFDRAGARRELRRAFGEGTTRLVDLGELCDKIYILPDEG